MKLSDIKGERTFDVIAEIIDPIANIAEDEAVSELFSRQKLPEGMTPKKFMLKRAKKAVPALLRGHKDDIIAILSSIADVSPDEYKGALSIAKLIHDCFELLTDETFLTLFTSAQSGTNSGSAQESTVAVEA